MDSKEALALAKEIAEENKAAYDSLKAEIKELKAKKGRFKGGDGVGISLQESVAAGIVEQTDNIKTLAETARDGIGGFRFELKTVGDMAITTNLTGGTGLITDYAPGIVANPARPTHIRDILPKSPMNGMYYNYLKENGAGEGSFTMVSEAGSKSQVDFDLVEQTVKAEVCAGWVTISNQMLEDVPSLVGFLSTRLVERLLVKEDEELCWGSGSTPEISGINTSGNYTSATGSATIDIEQLVQAISQLAALGRQPSGIILNPTDYFALALNKAATSGDYSLPSMVSVGPDGGVRVAGVPTIFNASQTLGQFTVGDFNSGSLLLIRKSPEIKFIVDATLAKKNQTLVRLEERIALAIYGSTYIVRGTF
jgi:HK97 family phage major capsid protein